MMQTIRELSVLEGMRRRDGGLLILFGAADCGVCQAIKPKLEMQLAERFVALRQAYVDCNQARPVCAQSGIFSLPVVQVWFNGMKFIEVGRAFSLTSLVADIDRLYQRFDGA